MGPGRGVVVLDGNEYVDCEMVGAVLVFSGGEIPKISGCRIEGCEWRFDGPAQQTMFLSSRYPEDRPTVETLIDIIRGNPAAIPKPPRKVS